MKGYAMSIIEFIKVRKEARQKFEEQVVYLSHLHLYGIKEVTFSTVDDKYIATAVTELGTVLTSVYDFTTKTWKDND